MRIFPCNTAASVAAELIYLRLISSVQKPEVVEKLESDLITNCSNEMYRGYFKVARRYEYYFPVVKTIYGQKSEQANREDINPAGKCARYIFFHIFTSKNMENVSVLVYGKTPITI